MFRRMGRALVAVGAALLLCFATLGVVVFVTREEDRVAVDNLLAEDLSRAIALAEGRGDDIDLSQLADFSWDRVLIVAPDTPREEISRALGTEFTGDLNYSAESQELLVFADGKSLARFADYRGRGRFEGFAQPVDELMREDAVLVVRDLVVTRG